MTGIVDFNKTFDTSTLHDKIILVTGGASGLGAAIVLRLSELGARVTIADINSDLGTAYTHSLTSRGYNVTFIPTDVRSFPSQLSAFRSTLSTSPSHSIHHVIAVAGVTGTPFLIPSAPSPSADPEPPPTDTIDVNYRGLYYTTKLAQHYLPTPQSSTAPGTAPTASKSLTFMGSLGGYMDIPPLADYVASKFAVRGLFRAIRLPMRDLGVRTNLIAPWLMDTPLVTEFAAQFRERGVPVGRPVDVAEAVLRCCVDEGICGRAIGVGAEETFDLRDDAEGMDGGVVVREFFEKGGQRYQDVMLEMAGYKERAGKGL